MRIILNLLLIYFAIWSATSFAQTPVTPTTPTTTTPTTNVVTMTSFSNYFYRVDNFPSANGAPTIIYAGQTALGAIHAPVDVNTPYNSCADPGTTWGIACNSQEINPLLNFSFSMASTNAYTCSAGLLVQDSSQTTISGGTITNNTPQAANQVVTSSIPWSTICTAGGTSTNNTCTSSFTTSLTFGFNNCTTANSFQDNTVQVTFNFRKIDSSFDGAYQSFNNCTPGSITNVFEGFCHFAMFPGDEKAYIFSSTVNAANGMAVEATPLNSGTPDGSGIHFRALRIFYATGYDSSSTPTDPANFKGNSESILTPQSPFSDLQSDTGGSLNSKIISSLSNDVIYIFGSANVDDSGNVTFYSRQFDEDFTKGVSQPVNTLGTTQSISPEPVYGLLDKKSCFIATAAYGSEMGPELDMLRRFRNEILAKVPGGIPFIRWYYRNGPIYAAWLNEHPALKPVVRAFLWPLIFISDLILEKTTLVICIAIGILIAMISAIAINLRGRQQMRRRGGRI